MSTRLLLAVLVLAVRAFPNSLSCPAGMTLGNFELTVTRGEGSAPIPLNKINQLEEGDTVSYSPVLRPKEKRPGEVSVVLIAARPSVGEQQDFTVLEPKDAEKPAKWKVPYGSSLAIYVYGPSGLSTRKLKGFLSNDKELVAQLAEYAEKTEKTEAVLNALNTYEATGHTEGLQAALTGFAGQYGSASNNKIDRTASFDQQGLAALRTLNPALAAYDPISNPVGPQRVTQTTALATTVAGMFFGSTVGLAAGGAALTLNLKSLMFPDTEFRSAYTQQLENKTNLALCSGRDMNQNRKRRAYLWAIRVPGETAPPLSILEANHIPAGLKTMVPVRTPDPQWKLVSRASAWSLASADDPGRKLPVNVIPAHDRQALEINLASAQPPPGRYRLTGQWDWNAFEAQGDIWIHPLSSFSKVALTPESQVRLQEHSGKQVLTLSGDDFQFVEKVTLARKGDKYASPMVVPFTLPLGERRGVQNTLEMQVDTAPLTAGEYTLALAQQGGEAKPVDVQVLPVPPKIAALPVVVNSTEGGEEDTIVLTGEGLDRITALEADGVKFELSAPEPGGKSRVIRFTSTTDKRGPADLRVSIRDYAAPLTMNNALLMSGPKPRIIEAQPSLPADMPIALRKGELPAGMFINLLLRTTGLTPESRLELGCSNMQADRVVIRPGLEENRVKLQSVQGGSMFLAIDAGRWPSGCRLTAAIDAGPAGQSKPFELGRVVRLPVIESFKLTDEPAGEGVYTAVLTGRDLELIGKTGWDAEKGEDVPGLPVAVVGGGSQQSLKVRMRWPSPTPRAPLYIWFRGEKEGRLTSARP